MGIAVLVVSVVMPGWSSTAYAAEPQPLSAGDLPEQALLGDEGERTTIPYTRFWLSESWRLYLRSSASAGSIAYVYYGTNSSYYSPHPSNWRLIQRGSYRLVKNSSTGKCIQYGLGRGYMMQTCNLDNKAQWMRIYTVVHDNIPRALITHYDRGTLYCLDSTGVGAAFPAQFRKYDYDTHGYQCQFRYANLR